MSNLTIEQVHQWRQAAIADGWSAKPTYVIESEEDAATLHKDGFTVQTLARAAGTIAQGLAEQYANRPNLLEMWKRRNDTASIAIWGPDGLAIPPVVPYDFAALQAALTICNECGAQGETVRLGFAGRVCPSCRKKLAPIVEYSGWCD